MQRIMFTILTIVPLLISCTSLSIDPTAIPSAVPQTNTSEPLIPYPVPNPTDQMPAYPYTQPAIATSSPIGTLTPVEVVEGSGSIRGVLIDTEGKPVANIFVFLANITESPAGPIISFTLESQKGGTNDQGQFVIANVPPGVYSLAIWTPAVNFLIPAPNGEEGSAIRVEVRSGQITELGEIRIRRP